MESSVALADIAAAIELIRPFFPLGTPAALGLALAYETVVELQAVQSHVNPEALQAALANRLGGDVAEVMKERFGG
jgi:hypothetical protein